MRFQLKQCKNRGKSISKSNSYSHFALSVIKWRW